MENQVNKSYVFSVSVGTGCYRHIQINATATLYDLHCGILNSFGYSAGQKHAFFLNNKIWSDTEAYYDSLEDGKKGELSASKKLCDFPFEKGQKFLYVYDFKQELKFAVKLLREEDNLSETKVIRSKGDAPSYTPASVPRAESTEIERKETVAKDKDMAALIKRYNMPAVSQAKSQPVRVHKIGRNEPCPCGSGKKYKKCCLNKS